MKKNKAINIISIILLLIGGLCWGLVGAFDFEPISAVFNGAGEEGQMGMSSLTRLVYILIGLSAIYRIILWAKDRE